MEPPYGLSQLALCCGFRNRRRRPGFMDLPQGANYYYSPSMMHINSGNTWPIMNHQQFSLAPPQHQPYILLTQPVIITSNPAGITGANAPNSMTTLIQHQATSPYRAVSIIGTQSASQHQQQPPQQQPNIMSSQYAIYQTAGGIGVTSSSTTKAIGTDSNILPSVINNLNHPGLIRNQSFQVLNGRQQPLAIEHQQQTFNKQNQQQNTNAPALTAETFKRLDLIDKQVDLSACLELIEQNGIVITNAIDPQTLAPYLSDETLTRYHAHFQLSDDYIIRFIEIIKRPGQALGLYIRTVQFENPQTGLLREGVVITKIESDSPIYDSQVLHVGDEILSINLIEVQGMNLDDVVVIMSIPKRLVLALRIPRERDQLIQDSIQRQRQQLMSSTTQYRLLNSGNQILSRTGLHNRATTPLSDAEARKGYSTGAREDCNHQNQIQPRQVDPTLFHARPVRVHSATHMNEILDCRSPILEIEGPLGRSVVGDATIPQRPASSLEKRDWSDKNPLFETANQLKLQEQKLMSGPHLDRQTAITRSMDENGQHNTNNWFQNFAIDQELANLERDAMIRDRPVVNLSHEQELSNNYSHYQQHSGITTTIVPLPSTLPRRTLPMRPPDLGMSSLKQPVIGNLRLGPTPEQSSYFSSSIDAINRELKELRRQRMALSNGEPKTNQNDSN